MWQDLKLQGPQENQLKALVEEEYNWAVLNGGCISRKEGSHELGKVGAVQQSGTLLCLQAPPSTPTSHCESSWSLLAGTLTHFQSLTPTLIRQWSPLRRLYYISASQPALASPSLSPHPHTDTCASSPGIQESWPGIQHPFPAPQGTPCLLPSSLPGLSLISPMHL